MTEQVRLKNAEDISKLRAGGKILARILDGLAKAARVGVTTSQLNKLAEQLIEEADAKPAFRGYGQPPFPTALCTSLNSCVVHGIPSDYRLKDGDLLGLDCGIIYDGLFTDAAISVGIGSISSQVKKLLEVTRNALDETLSIIKSGVTTGDIGAETQTIVEKAGFNVVRDLAGHGVGYAVHEPPTVSNYGKPGTGTKLEAGAVIAVEPMVTAGDWRLKTAPNGWDACTLDGSLSAHFERTVVVTPDGYEDLTPWRGV